MQIPLHSLVFCTSDQLNSFVPHERLSKQLIQRDLVGDDSRIELSSIVFDELRHRINLKLSLGQRVVVCIDGFNAEAQSQLSLIARNQGASVIEFNEPVLPTLSGIPNLSDWDGITVIGDIHGDHKALEDASAWAQGRRHFMWLLGDIIDYGADTLRTMSSVYRAVMNGNAALILGNHERKIARWLDQKESGKVNLRVSDGNRVTINALAKLNQIERRQWIGQFRSLLAHSSLMFQMNHITLVHGAIHPSLWTNRPDEEAIEQYALYGESEHAGKRFRRTYRWMDEVPKDQMVFIGHDMLHTIPTVKTGAKGGQVVFLDTGCGKGGRLSSADLKFNQDGLRLECFKRY